MKNSQDNSCPICQGDKRNYAQRSHRNHNSVTHPKYFCWKSLVIMSQTGKRLICPYVHVFSRSIMEESSWVLGGLS